MTCYFDSVESWTTSHEGMESIAIRRITTIQTLTACSLPASLQLGAYYSTVPFLRVLRYTWLFGNALISKMLSKYKSSVLEFKYILVVLKKWGIYNAS